VAKKATPWGDVRADELGKLVEPMRWSALVVATCLMMTVLAPIMAAQESLQGSREILLRASLGLLSAMVWIEIWSLWVLTAPAEEISEDMADVERNQAYFRSATQDSVVIGRDIPVERPTQ
jgi:hypothetical protein